MATVLGFEEFVQYAVTGGSTVAIANIQGGEWGNLEQEFAQHDGAGGKTDVVQGMVFGRDTVESIYKGESLLSASARTVYNGLPPYILSWGGAVNAASMSYKATGYVNTVKIACGGIGEPVKVDYEIMQIQHSKVIATADNVVTNAATAPFIWMNGAVTINGVACGCQSFEVEHNENLRAESSLDAGTTPLRWPEEILPGNDQTNVRASVKVPLALDLTLDTPTLPITASFLIGNGYTTKTITVRQLYLANQPTKLEKGESTVIWDLDFQGLNNPLSAAATAGFTVA